jgi:putative addiction module component (TIGR02574 family)
MDLQQTWAQVQALSIGDRHKILKQLVMTLPPPDWEEVTEDELIAELEQRIEDHDANPEGSCTFEEFKATYYMRKK